MGEERNSFIELAIDSIWSRKQKETYKLCNSLYNARLRTIGKELVK